MKFKKKLAVWKRAKKDVWLWFWVGLFIRLLIVPFFMNWDFWANTRLVAEFVQSGSLAQVYANPLGTFPPLLFWTLGGYFKLVWGMLGSGFGEWLGYKELSALSSVNIFRYMLVLKVIYLAAEMGAGYVLALMFSGKERALVWRWWMLSPVVIYAVEMFTNIDALPLVFMVLSLYWLKKEKGVRASVAMGLAAAYKMFPVLLFPLVVMQARGVKEKLVRAAVMVGVFVGTQVPAWGLSGYWSQVVFGDSGQALWSARVSLGGERAIYVYLLVYVVVLFWYGQGKKTFERLMLAGFGVMGGIFAFSVFHLQWFLWLVPWLMFYGVGVKQAGWELWLANGMFWAMVAASAVSLNLGMLGPGEPTFWYLEWPVRGLVGERVFWLLGILQTCLAAALAGMGYKWWRVIGTRRMDAQA